MSNMICPFCQQELKIAGEHTTIMSCFNGDCKGSGLYGEKAFWQELIRTRKALDVAVKRLGYIKNNYKNWTPDRDELMIAQAVNGLDEIKTALEQGGDNE